MVQEYNDAYAEQQALPRPRDPTRELADARERQRVWDQYDRDKERYDRQMAANRESMAKLRELGPVPGQEAINALSDLLTECIIYENNLHVYEEAKHTFEQLTAEIEEKRTMAEEFRKGAEALSDARATLKTLLAPSLTRVASKLIRDMTNGKLTDIVVDDEMEISVNGQRIETLSGGGETVANLALRLALGQVLVAHTFPVFIGDEMDSDADDSRRAGIAEAFVGLRDRGHLKQIILITHRSLDIADENIILGDKIED
jgi:DNA repair exonuclease SbcCD ATPase subunit